MGFFSPSRLTDHSTFYKLCNEKIIEKLHLKCCKYILAVNRKSTNSAVMAELGRFPLFFNVLLSMIKYWIRLETSENNLLKEALILSKNIHNHGQTSWYSFIVKLLELLDLNPHNL